MKFLTARIVKQRSRIDDDNYGLSNIGSNEEPVRSNVCSAPRILQGQEIDWLFCAVFLAFFSESLGSESLGSYRDLLVILLINIRLVLISQ